MKNKNKIGVFAAVREAALTHLFLTLGTVLCVAASVGASLIPPLLLARVIDDLTGGIPLSFAAVLLYFGSLALEGVLSSAQETLLVGDRIYTDIASGANAGIDTLLVLSGETKEEDLPTADPQPTFVLPDVAALLNILES